MFDWRPMTAADLGAVVDIAARLHPDNYERPEVFLSHIAVYPDGCRLLVAPDGQPVGYGFAHPALSFQPPALDCELHALPPAPQCLHLHDVAVLPPARGCGAVGRLLDWLRHLARRDGIGKLALVSVNRTEEYWRHHGFVERHDTRLDAALQSYCGGAIYMTQDIAV